MASRRGNNSAQVVGRPGERIRFAVGQSSLGSILVASSETGVVSIMIGEDRDRLVEELKNRFPSAILVRGDRNDVNLVTRVVDFVEEPAHGLDVPLDIKRDPISTTSLASSPGEIPAGQTSTYTDIANKIGAPKAMRAVGNACAKSTIAIAIPLSSGGAQRWLALGRDSLENRPPARPDSSRGRGSVATTIDFWYSRSTSSANARTLAASESELPSI